MGYHPVFLEGCLLDLLLVLLLVHEALHVSLQEVVLPLQLLVTLLLLAEVIVRVSVGLFEAAQLLVMQVQLLRANLGGEGMGWVTVE